MLPTNLATKPNTSRTFGQEHISPPSYCTPSYSFTTSIIGPPSITNTQLSSLPHITTQTTNTTLQQREAEAAAFLDLQKYAHFQESLSWRIVQELVEARELEHDKSSTSRFVELDDDDVDTNPMHEEKRMLEGSMYGGKEMRQEEGRRSTDDIGRDTSRGGRGKGGTGRGRGRGRRKNVRNPDLDPKREQATEDYTSAPQLEKGQNYGQTIKATVPRAPRY